MLQYWDIVLLTIRFLYVAKFTILIPLTLLISCKLSFPIVDLKMSSLPASELKSATKKSCGTSGTDPVHSLVPHKSYPL
jgi:hypothetical protein